MENNLNVIYKNLDEIIPYENNPRNNELAVEKVKNSIKEFGFNVPILIDENDIIIAGHTRYKASEELGLKEVPCIYMEHLTPVQVRAFRLADNKVAEFSDWDFEKLEEEINSIENEFTGFSTEEMEKMFGADEEEESFNDVGGDLKETIEVIIECEDEQEQRELYERMTAEGYTCRVLTL